MSHPDQNELFVIGLNAVTQGELSAIRAAYNLSQTAMAHLMGVQPEALTGWETFQRGMTRATAIRVGEWVWGVRTVEESLNQEPVIKVDDLIPISLAAQYLNTSVLELEARAVRGQLPSENLGVLGRFIYRTAIHLKAKAA